MYINRLDKNLQLLIPDRSAQLYNETLKKQVSDAVKKRPYYPTEDEQMLIRADSARLYPTLLKDHYKQVLNPYVKKLNELYVFRRSGF